MPRGSPSYDNLYSDAELRPGHQAWKLHWLTMHFIEKVTAAFNKQTPQTATSVNTATKQP